MFDVKLKAIDAMHAVDFDLILVTTVVRSVNDAEVGPILDLVIRNADKFGGVSLQPVSFTGRDENTRDIRPPISRWILRTTGGARSILTATGSR